MKNIAIIEGRLGQDANLAYTSGSKPVTTLSVAINRKWKTESGEKKEAVDWITGKCWGRLAKPASKLQKGDAVAVSGSIRTSTYTKDGAKHTFFYIQADHLRLIDFSIYSNETSDANDEMLVEDYDE